MKKIDNLHYSYRAIDGFPQPFKFVMSPREPGKTTMLWLKFYNAWKIDKRPHFYLVRQVVEICDSLITTIFDSILNVFTDDNIEPQYNKGAFKDGIVDVKINGEIFFRLVALSIKTQRIKKTVLNNARGSIMDEYIVNPKFGEKYLQGEAEKIKEAYSTWRRGTDKDFTMYFLGNPYSLFNPLFVDWGVNIADLKKGKFTSGDIYVIHWAELNPELKKQLLEKNPLYKFDEDYSNYAIEGQAVNDIHIKTGDLPPNYRLKLAIRIEGHIIGIFQNQFYEDKEDRFYCKFIEDVSEKRTIFCFEFSELVDRTCLLSLEDRLKFQKFKEAMRKRLVSFQNINCYYFIEEVYKNI